MPEAPKINYDALARGVGRGADSALLKQAERIEELEVCIRAALSFVQGRHTDPNDGHAGMVIAAMRGALAKRERD